MTKRKSYLLNRNWLMFFSACCLFFAACKKTDFGTDDDITLSFTVNSVYNGTLSYTALNVKPVVKINFSDPVDPASLAQGLQLTNAAGTQVTLQTTLQNENKTIEVVPQDNLASFSTYQLKVNPSLRSAQGGLLLNPVTIQLRTGIDSADKFPVISDTALVELVQRQTFKYFWDFAHPVSGLTRERNTSTETVTTGGSGFGVMAILTGIHRNFITKAEGLARMQKIVGFLKNNAQKFHGAFPHWMNGTTGVVQPFSAKDNGADLVETAFMVQGLLCARQYFNGADPAETALRDDINLIWRGVEWSWFRKGTENVLYWHWSPNFNWEVNVPLRGWNEGLVTYVLAASSPTFSIPKIVYDNGWARSGAMRNGNTYYGHVLPLGPNLGGPLFLEHYSFMGIDPFGLSDAYANYQTQVVNHTKINYEYVKANPKNFYGYSDQNWGLTASDIPSGYAASSPTNDLGVIAPTAALSSFPYTPNESMKALKFFYYKLGDKIWGEYGFKDAFSLQEGWFASSYLAIDQGPIIVMMENYRSGLLWNLFMSAPEVKTGMRALGFQGPHL